MEAFARVTEVVGRSEQGATRPFFCYVDAGAGHFLLHCVKGAYAGKNSLCCEWVASRLAECWLDGEDLSIPQFRQVRIVEELVESSARADIADLGEGLAFASLFVLAQEITWTDAQRCSEEAMATLLPSALWLRNEDRSLSPKGGKPESFVGATFG